VLLTKTFGGATYDQVRKLPPGTKISGFKMVDDRLQLS
jgi:hypothetical protein